jgi:hypothetical protein
VFKLQFISAKREIQRDNMSNLNSTLISARSFEHSPPLGRGGGNVREEPTAAETVDLR